MMMQENDQIILGDNNVTRTRRRRRLSSLSSSSSIALVLASFLVSRDRVVSADFVFADFNGTRGLSWAGHVNTTNCIPIQDNDYGTVQTNQPDVREAELPITIEESLDMMMETRTYTSNTSIKEQQAIDQQSSRFGHHSSSTYRTSQDYYDKECPVRVRLTPSQPHQTGAMWFTDPVPIDKGFETLFTFQISDPSTVCTTHRDAFFSLQHHKSCSVHGGDGFAFVIQGQSNQVIGQGASELGFGGLSNSFAIAFDTWYNAEEGSGDDIVVDHVSVHTRGPHSNNTAREISMLGRPHPANLSDGQIHLAKIIYLPEIQPQYLPYFTASDALLPYIMDAGENRRVGTLAIFLDEGVASNIPLLALPINLHTVLDLPLELAYVGFTAATGNAWEKHDILSWYWCDDEPCQPQARNLFDYHQRSVYYTGSKHHYNEPGEGYGGGGDFMEPPTQNESPPTTPLGYDNPKTISRLAGNGGSIDGLYAQASQQVPPNTEL